MNEEQKQLAEESLDRQAASLGAPIYTEILPYTGFYLAEEYHQKYRLRQQPNLLQEFQAIYPDAEAFVNSTAVMRVNGYVGGHGTLTALQAEIDALGLSPEARAKLLEIVAAREP